MSNIRTILHPTDFSASANEALAVAGSLARHHGAKLVLLHVVQRPVSNVAGMPVPPPPPQVIDWESLKSQLSDLIARTKGIQAESRLVEADPATAIVQTATELRADLIVIGTHGRTGLSRLLMGSVAEQVIRNATCPVLTAKTPAVKSK